MGTADEENFMELLIANERTWAWLDEMDRVRPGSTRIKAVLKDMARAVTTREAYAEEARKEGAVPKLTKLLKQEARHGDEEVLDMISSILAACSGPMASGTKIKTLYYQGIPIVVKEGALGDGVGAKVWTVAHTLCQEMRRNPLIVKDCNVLEIGAGCGPCGFIAAKLGASHVVISDYVKQLLLNLRDALHLNDFSSVEINVNNETDKDKDICVDIDSITDNCGESADIDELSREATTLPLHGDDRHGHGQHEEKSSPNLGWDNGNVAVRFLDWKDSLIYLSTDPDGEDGKEAKNSVLHGKESSSTSHCALDGEGCRAVAPGIPSRDQFDVVIGTDILYEWDMTETVAAAISHKLRPGGRALICNAVRDQGMFDALIECMKSRGLRVGVNRIEPENEDGGVAPHDQEYEGGFVLVAAEHQHAPARDWHRVDLFDS